MTEDGPPPPALGVSVNVAGTPVLPATRSDAATLKVTLLTFVEHAAMIPRRLYIP